MDSLRRTGRPEEAVALLQKTVNEDPGLALGLLASLRLASRHADVKLLLDMVADAEPAVCGHVAGSLWCSGDVADLQWLLDSIESRDLLDLAEAAEALEDVAARAHMPATQRNPLILRLLARPVREFAVTIANLRILRRTDDAGALISVLGHGSPHEVCAAAAELAAARMPQDAGALLDRYALTAATEDLAEFFIELARTWEQGAAVAAPTLAAREDSAEFLSALRDAGPEEESDLRVAMFVRFLSSGQAVALCGHLSERNAAEELNMLLTWCARRDDAASVRAELHDAGMHAVAYRLAERLAEVTGHYDRLG